MDGAAAFPETGGPCQPLQIGLAWLTAERSTRKCELVHICSPRCPLVSVACWGISGAQQGRRRRDAHFEPDGVCFLAAVFVEPFLIPADLSFRTSPSPDSMPPRRPCSPRRGFRLYQSLVAPMKNPPGEFCCRFSMPMRIAVWRTYPRRRKTSIDALTLS